MNLPERTPRPEQLQRERVVPEWPRFDCAAHLQADGTSVFLAGFDRNGKPIRVEVPPDHPLLAG